MSQLHQSYLDLLAELSGSLDRLSQLARDKAAAIQADDLIALDEVLKQEQAMTLNLRELAPRARSVSETLRESYTAYRSCADMARTLLELNLHQLEKVITAAGVDPAVAAAGYEPPGVEPPKKMKTDFRA